MVLPFVVLPVKERNLNGFYVHEICAAADRLIKERNCRIVLIPFHFSEDMPAIEMMERYLAERGAADRVCAVKRKYLTEEMLSLIGNMDTLVGVRLHALIHAAIMDVPMIGISYDPQDKFIPAFCWHEGYVQYIRFQE